VKKPSATAGAPAITFTLRLAVPVAPLVSVAVRVTV